MVDCSSIELIAISQFPNVPPGEWVLLAAAAIVVAIAVTRESVDRTLVELPKPRLSGAVSVEQAIAERRSLRSFHERALSLELVSQILWAAQGVSSSDGKRTVPSAGGLLPLEIYLLAGSIEELEAGLYRYEPALHVLRLVSPGDRRVQLATISHEQMWMAAAPAAILVAAVYERTTGKFGAEARKYVDMEVGHVGQNVHLEACALGLGTVVVAAFDPAEVSRLLDLPNGETPLYVMPIGHPI